MLCTIYSFLPMHTHMGYTSMHLHGKYWFSHGMLGRLNLRTTLPLLKSRRVCSRAIMMLKILSHIMYIFSDPTVLVPGILPSYHSRCSFVLVLVHDHLVIHIKPSTNGSAAIPRAIYRYHMMDDDDALPVSTVDQQSAGHFHGIDKGAFLKEPLPTYLHHQLTTCVLHIEEFALCRAQPADQLLQTHNAAVSISSRAATNLYMHQLVQRSAPLRISSSCQRGLFTALHPHNCPTQPDNYSRPLCTQRPPNPQHHSHTHLTYVQRRSMHYSSVSPTSLPDFSTGLHNRYHWRGSTVVNH